MNKFKKVLDLIADSAIGRKIFIVMLYLIMLAGFLYVSLAKDYFFPPQSLCVYSFTDMFHTESIAAFERIHRVKVVLRYFESNEELYAKFMINKGAGYDVVMISDYMVELLAKKNMLLPLDQNALPVSKELDSRLLDRSFDKQNRYSLPFSWIPYGIIFNKEIFAELPTEISLSLLFDDPKKRHYGIVKPYKISMTDDAREALLLASLYLFGNTNNWSSSRLEQAKNLLIEQKAWVESYVNQDLTYPLLSGSIKVAMAPLFTVDKVLKSSDKFCFMLPKEGSMYSIENLTIPKISRQKELAHKFINFILSGPEAARMSNFYGMNPSNATAYSILRPDLVANIHAFPRDAYFSRLQLISNNVPVKDFEEIWLAVKSS